MNITGEILVVDDDEETRHLLGALLERDGHRVRVARNGEDALAQMLDGDVPDVVVLDLDMPVMNGAECARQMGEHPLLAGVAILICSGADRATLATVTRAQAYVPKPVDVPRLLAAVSRLVAWRRGLRSTA